MTTGRANLRAVVTTAWCRGLMTVSVTGLLLLLVAVVPAASAGAAASTSVRNTPRGALLATLPDPVAAENDLFGYTVAVSGKTAVVGAPYTNSDAGIAYIYQKGTSGWPTAPTATLSDPAASGNDQFGWSVDVTGKTVIVGAPGSNSSAGAAYIYVKDTTGWPTAPTTTLPDPGEAGDEFGYSVAISRSPVMTVVVGAPGTSDRSVGSTYVFVNSGSAWPTTPTAALSDPAATEGDDFGISVAISGETIVASSGQFSLSGIGVAYIYVNSGSGWPTTPTTYLSDPWDKADDHFGYSVAASGATVVVGAFGTDSGAGRVYIYVKGASGWPTTPTTRLRDPADVHDWFGLSVSVKGTTIVVGASGARSNPGAAYMYVKSGSGWPTTPTTTIDDPGGSANDAFGYSVAVFGKTAIVGSPGTNVDTIGSAYIYKA